MTKLLNHTETEKRRGTRDTTETEGHLGGFVWNSRRRLFTGKANERPRTVG